MEGRPAELTGPSGVTIRPGRRDDAELDAVRAVEVDAGQRFLEVGRVDIAEAEPPSRTEVRAAVSAGRLWVAVDDASGDVVGYARAEDLDGRSHLEQVSVRVAHQGRGVGGALIDAVLDWARARGADELTLTTFRAVAFNQPYYERRGFRPMADAALDDRLRALVAREASHGLDPLERVVMARTVTSG